MVELRVADGKPIIDVREWDGTKWVSRIVKVNTDSGWIDSFRPTMFSDNAMNVSGVIRRSTTATIANDGFRFKTNITFNLEAV